MAQNKVAVIIGEMVAPVADRAGVELVDVEFVKEGGRWFLRIFIDKPGGVGLDDCQAVSEQVDRLLDEKDPIEYSYTLEVSSPGIERPLKKLSDYERFKGHLVNITTYAPLNGQKRFTGHLAEASQSSIILDIKGSQMNIPMEQVASAKLAVEF